MKKLVIILMLILLVYNTVGYFIVFHIQRLLLQYQISNCINSGEFSEEDLTVFKIPIQEYYEHSSQDFDRVEGDFEHDGKLYQTVKKTIENDTVFVWCLNNSREEKLLEQLASHFQTHVLDTQPVKSEKAPKSFKDLFKEYLPKTPFRLQAPLFALQIERMRDPLIPALLSSHTSIVTPPPEVS